VIVDDKIIHSNTSREKLQTPHQAEAKALYMLLNYIQDHIELGSMVEMYGDDKTLIDKILHYTGQKHRELKIRLFYEALKTRYSISLSHISSKNNTMAHNLSRTVYNTQSNLMQIDNLMVKELHTERRYMSLDEIFIPEQIKRCRLPSPKNYNKRLQYFQQHGRDHKSKTILINSNGKMVAGYITYLIAKDSGITSCYVDVLPDHLDLVAA